LQLIAKGLCCERGGRKVFSDVNFAVAEGELLELRGANGAGKSSLLRMIAGLVEPSDGSINCAPEECHYIGHTDTNKPSLTVLENVTFWSGFMGSASTPQSLNHFKLEALANDQAYFLSAGQKRRLSLTRLVLAQRKLWLLDEPTVGLDQDSQLMLLNVMKNHLANRGMIIAATHLDLGLKANNTLTLETRVTN
jgi:heme exporter protein A